MLVFHLNCIISLFADIGQNLSFYIFIVSQSCEHIFVRLWLSGDTEFSFEVLFRCALSEAVRRFPWRRPRPEFKRCAAPNPEHRRNQRSRSPASASLTAETSRTCPDSRTSCSELRTPWWRSWLRMVGVTPSTVSKSTGRRGMKRYGSFHIKINLCKLILLLEDS